MRSHSWGLLWCWIVVRKLRPCVNQGPVDVSNWIPNCELTSGFPRGQILMSRNWIQRWDVSSLWFFVTITSNKMPSHGDDSIYDFRVWYIRARISDRRLAGARGTIRNQNLKHASNEGGFLFVFQMIRQRRDFRVPNDKTETGSHKSKVDNLWSGVAVDIDKRI